MGLLTNNSSLKYTTVLIVTCFALNGPGLFGEAISKGTKCFTSEETGQQKVADIPHLSGHVLNFQRPSAITITCPMIKTKLAKIKLTIVDEYGNVVKKQEDSLEENPTSLSWDGTDNQGLAVSNGTYQFNIEIIENDKIIYSYCSYQDDCLKLYKPKEFTVPVFGKVIYRIDEPCIVKIRVGVDDGALLRDILNYEVRPAGEHIENWEGTNDDQSVRFDDIANLEYTFSAFSLPRNTIFVVNSSREREQISNNVHNNDTTAAESQGALQTFFKTKRLPDLSLELKIMAQEFSDDRSHVPILREDTLIETIYNEKNLPGEISPGQMRYKYYLNGIDITDSYLDVNTYDLRITDFPAGRYVLTTCLYSEKGCLGTSSSYIDILKKQDVFRKEGDGM